MQIDDPSNNFTFRKFSAQKYRRYRLYKRWKNENVFFLAKLFFFLFLMPLYTLHCILFFHNQFAYHSNDEKFFLLCCTRRPRWTYMEIFFSRSSTIPIYHPRVLRTDEKYTKIGRLFITYFINRKLQLSLFQRRRSSILMKLVPFFGDEEFKPKIKDALFLENEDKTEVQYIIGSKTSI